jgi:hypothetical protein
LLLWLSDLFLSLFGSRVPDWSFQFFNDQERSPELRPLLPHTEYHGVPGKHL